LAVLDRDRRRRPAAVLVLPRDDGDLVRRVLRAVVRERGRRHADDREEREDDGRDLEALHPAVLPRLRRMSRAARRPAAIACTTVFGPVTTSPTAQTLSRAVRPRIRSATIRPRLSLRTPFRAGSTVR